MVSTDPRDPGNEDIAALLDGESRDRDGVGSLRDVQEEAGDEAAVRDAFDLDAREAQELGVGLDARDEPEPDLE